MLPKTLDKVSVNIDHAYSTGIKYSPLGHIFRYLNSSIYYKSSKNVVFFVIKYIPNTEIDR